MFTLFRIKILVVVLVNFTLINHLFSLTYSINGDTMKEKPCFYVKNTFNNGIIKGEGCYDKDGKQGIWKEYTEKGWKRFEWTYKNDVKNGVYKVFNKNGNISAIGMYKNGALCDTLTVFGENGQLVSKSLWKINGMGSRMVWEKIYDKQAKPDGTIEMIDGQEYIWNLGEKDKLKPEQ